ncbi:MAG: sensor histidine kinase [Chloroflexota bacterium]
MLGEDLQRLTGAAGIAACFRSPEQELEVESLVGAAPAFPADLPAAVGEVHVDGPFTVAMVYDGPDFAVWLVFLEAGRRNLAQIMAKVAPILGDSIAQVRRLWSVRRLFTETIGTQQSQPALMGSARREHLFRALIAAAASCDDIPLLVSEQADGSIEAACWDPEAGVQVQPLTDAALLERVRDALRSQRALALRTTLAERMAATMGHPGQVEWLYVAPLIHASQVVGLFGLAASLAGVHCGLKRAMQAQIVERVQMLVREAGAFLDRAAVHEQAYVDGMTSERAHLGLDLHDSVLQGLTYIELQLGRLDELIEKDPGAAKNILGQVRSTLHTTSREARELAIALTTNTDSANLVELLQGAMARFESRFDGEVTLHVEGAEYPIAATVNKQLMWMFQEILNNIWKHAAASRVSTTVRFQSHSVSLVVEDNGRGFVVEEQDSSRIGLRGLEQRAQQVGATFNIRSEVGTGTTMEIQVPL